jgi:hypothetical protein
MSGEKSGNHGTGKEDNCWLFIRELARTKEKHDANYSMPDRLLVQNHPFLDGNKRAGAAASLTFLELNGVETEIPPQALVDIVLSVANGKTAKPAIAEFFRRYVKH